MVATVVKYIVLIFALIFEIICLVAAYLRFKKFKKIIKKRKEIDAQLTILGRAICMGMPFEKYIQMPMPKKLKEDLIKLHNKSGEKV